MSKKKSGKNKNHKKSSKKIFSVPKNTPPQDNFSDIEKKLIYLLSTPPGPIVDKKAVANSILDKKISDAKEAVEPGGYIPLHQNSVVENLYSEYKEKESKNSHRENSYISITKLELFEENLISLSEGIWEGGGREMLPLPKRKKITDKLFFAPESVEENEDLDPDGLEFLNSLGLMDFQKDYMGIWADNFTDAVICITDYSGKNLAENYLNKIFYKKNDELYYSDGENIFKVEQGKTSLSATVKKCSREIIFDKTGKLLENVIEYNSPKVWRVLLKYGKDEKNYQRYILPACNFRGIEPRRWFEAISYCRLEDFEYWKGKNPTCILQPYNKNFDELINIGTLAIFMGNWANYRYGSAMLSENFARKAFKKYFKDKDNIKTIKGSVVQICPYLCRISAAIVGREYINEFIEQNTCEEIILYRDGLDEEKISDLWQSIFKTSGSKYEGKLVIITDEYFTGKADDIDFLTDLSTFTNPVDFRKKSGLNVLDMSKNSFGVKDGVFMDKSFLARLVSIDSVKGYALSTVIWEKYVKNRFEEINPENPLINPSEMEIFENPKLAGLKMFGKKYIQMFPEEYKEIIDELVTELKETLEEYEFPTDGVQSIIVSDPAKDFGVNILDCCENYIEAICLFTEKSQTELVGTISAKDAPTDLFKIKIISPKEYIERLKRTLALTEKQRRILEEQILETSYGVIVLPAISTLPKNPDGSNKNFFGAKINLYFAQEIIDFIWNADTFFVDNGDNSMYTPWKNVSLEDLNQSSQTDSDKEKLIKQLREKIQMQSIENEQLKIDAEKIRQENESLLDEYCEMGEQMTQLKNRLSDMTGVFLREDEEHSKEFVRQSIAEFNSPISELRSKTANLKVCVVGGGERWQRKIAENFPDFLILQTKEFDTKKLDNADLLIIHSKKAGTLAKTRAIKLITPIL